MTYSLVITTSPHLFPGGEVIHEIQHQVLDDHAEAAGAEVTLGGPGGNGVERFGGEGQLDAFVAEQRLGTASRWRSWARS